MEYFLQFFFKEIMHMHNTFNIFLTDHYLIGDRPNCKDNGTYCSYIGDVCICRCLPGYITVNGRCLHGNILNKCRLM